MERDNLPRYHRLCCFLAFLAHGHAKTPFLCITSASIYIGPQRLASCLGSFYSHQGERNLDELRRLIQQAIRNLEEALGECLVVNSPLPIKESLWQVASIDITTDQANGKVIENHNAVVEHQNNYLQSWRLAVVIGSLCLGIFLLALDMNIIGVAIPQITSDFNSLNDIAWYGFVQSPPSSHCLETCTSTSTPSRYTWPRLPYSKVKPSTCYTDYVMVQL